MAFGRHAVKALEHWLDDLDGSYFEVTRGKLGVVRTMRLDMSSQNVIATPYLFLGDSAFEEGVGVVFAPAW